MRVAETIGQRSVCSRDQVGAVVVDSNNRIVDTGYNGPPRGMYQLGGDCRNWCPRARASPMHDGSHLSPSYDDCYSLHAEQNALMFSDRRLRQGGKIYVSSGVCSVCAKLIANSGLIEVVMLDRGTTSGVDDSHRKTNEWTEFLEKCGITVVTLL